MKLRRCRDCGKEFPETEEHFQRTGNWLRRNCRGCQREYFRAYDVANKAKRAKWMEDKLRENPSYRAEKTKRWYEKYPEKYQEYRQRYMQKYNQTNERREYFREWWKNNPKRRRVYNHKYRARKRMAEGKHSLQDIEIQYKRQKGCCYYLRGGKHKLGENYEIEHVVPLSRNGTNDMGNIVLACQTCNRMKHDKLPHEWFEGGRLV